MTAICFDIGSEKSITAVMHHNTRNFTLLNEIGKRETPTIIGFNSKNRVFGDFARNQQKLNPNNTIYGFKSLLGKRFNAVTSGSYINPCLREKLVQDHDGGVSIMIKQDQTAQSFTPEQMVGMILGKLKTSAELSLREEDKNFERIEDCVLSVPLYFNYDQLQKMKAAAEIAGMNCIGLIEDSTACALDYGFYKQAEMTQGNCFFTSEADYVLITNFGHSSLQVTSAKISKGKITILANTSSTEVGGELITRMIAQDLCQQIMKRYEIAPESEWKIKDFNKILNEAEKIKKRMSVDNQRIESSIDPLMGVSNVEFVYSHDDFQKNSEFLKMKLEIESTIKKCCEKSNKYKYDNIELVGGSSRISFFKDIIFEIFKKSPNRTLNEDESVARGGAIHFAKIQSDLNKICCIDENNEFHVSYKTKLKLAIEKKDSSCICFDVSKKIMISIQLKMDISDLKKCYLVREGLKMSEDWEWRGLQNGFGLQLLVLFHNSLEDGMLEISQANVIYTNKNKRLQMIMLQPCNVKEDIINVYREKENQLIQREDLENQRLKSRNKLESFTYCLKKKFTSLQNTQLEGLIRDLQNWLCDEGGNYPKEIYDNIVEHLINLEKVLENDRQSLILDDLLAIFKTILKQ